MSQIRPFPQVGLNIKEYLKHHPVKFISKMLVQSQSSRHRPSSHLRKIHWQISLQRSKLDQGILLDYGIPGHQKENTRKKKR